MNTRHFVFLPLCFLAAACGPSSEEKIEQEESFYRYDIRLDDPKVDFYDQVESIKLLGLEETDESLLRPFLKYLPTDDEILIVDEGEGTVCRYSKQGEYIDKFNHKGDGPQEYAGMQNTFWDGAALVTFDSRNDELLYFSISGDFLESKKIPTSAMHILKKEGEWYLSKSNVMEEDSLRFNVITLDENMQLKKRLMPVGATDPFPIMGSISDFRVFNDKILYNTMVADSVFMVEADTVKPYMSFSFGEDWFWTDEMKEDAGLAMSSIEQSDKVWVFTWFMTDNRVEIGYNITFEEHRKGFIDRATGRFYHYSGEEEEKIPLQYIDVEEGSNTFLGVTTFEGIEQIVEKVDESQIEVLGSLSLDDMLNMENPTLIWITYKTTVE